MSVQHPILKEDMVKFPCGNTTTVVLPALPATIIARIMPLNSANKREIKDSIFSGKYPCLSLPLKINNNTKLQ